MRALGAPDWNPIDDLLEWGISQSMDDLTPNPEFQNPMFLKVSTSNLVPHLGWQESARFDPTSATQQTVDYAYGSVGYVLLEVPQGGSFQIQADGVAFMLGRIR